MPRKTVYMLWILPLLSLLPVTAACGESAGRSHNGHDGAAAMDAGGDGGVDPDGGSEPDGGGSHVFEIVSDEGNDIMPVLVMDQDDRPSIFFVRSSSLERDGIRRAYKEPNGAWSSEELVADTGNSVMYLDAAMDLDGKPHLLYCFEHAEGRPPVYGTVESDQWRFADVVSEEAAYPAAGATFPSLALTSDSTPVFAYYAHDQEHVLFMQKQPSVDEWAVKIVSFPFFTQAIDVEMAVDSADNAHVAYVFIDSGRRVPFYARWDTNILQFVENQETFLYQQDTEPDVGSAVGFGLRAGDVPYFVIFDRKTNAVVYHERTGSYIWDSEVIEENVDAWIFLESASSQSGSVHVVYYDESTSSLKHAVRDQDLWSVSVLDEHPGGSQVYTYPSIALDSLGRAHVAYRDQSVHALKYIGPIE